MLMEGIVIGAGIAWISMGLGILRSRLHRPRPKPVKPICSCEHARSFREEGTGPCHSNGDYAGDYKYHPCGCQQYNGPEPLPEYFAPEISP